MAHTYRSPGPVKDRPKECTCPRHEDVCLIDGEECYWAVSNCPVHGWEGGEMAGVGVKYINNEINRIEGENAALRLQLAERGSELKALESRNAQLHDQVEYQAHEIEDLRRQLEVALLPTS